MRLNPAAYAFAGRCDGRTTVEEIWRLLLEREGEQAATQDEILRLLAQLSRAGLVQFDTAPNLSLLFPSPDTGARDQSFRLIVKPEGWGGRTRLRFSNAFGTQPVTFDADCVSP